MANNSSGARSVLYGKTIDHVLEQQVVLSDGIASRTFGRSTGDELDAGCAGDDARGARATATVRRAGARRTRDEIERRYPEGAAPRRRLQPRRVRRSGDGRSTWRKLMVGSEGTLGVVARGEGRAGAAAEGQGGAGDPVRRSARGARRRRRSILAHGRRRSR